MNVLIVTPFLPYPGVPHAGGKLVYFLLRTLAERHSVFLVSRFFPGEERNLGEIRDMLAGLELVPASGPVDEGNIRSVWRTVRSYSRLARRAREVLERKPFDLCQVEGDPARQIQYWQTKPVLTAATRLALYTAISQPPPSARPRIADTVGTLA